MKNCFSKVRSVIFLLMIFSPFFCLKAFCHDAEIEKTEIQKLIPDSTADLYNNRTQIEIRTDRKKTKVYLNGEFSGLTPLTIKNLIEGTYNIKLVFGDTEKIYELEVKKNLKQRFYIELFQNTSAPKPSGKKYKAQHGPLAEKAEK